MQGNCRGVFIDLLVSAMNTEIMKKVLHCGLQSRVFDVARTSFYDTVSTFRPRPTFLSQERFEWSGNSVVSILNINSHYCWKFIKICSFEARLQNCEKRLLDSSYLSNRHSAWNISAPSGRIFMKFGI